MASAWIPIDEVTRRVLEEDPNEVYSSFSDESEREISDHHVQSDSSDEEIAEGNGITSDSDDSDAEVYSNGMFCVCLFDLATIFMPQNFVVFAFMCILF